MLTHARSTHDSALWVQGYTQAFPSTGRLPVLILKQQSGYQKNQNLTFLFGCFFSWIQKTRDFPNLGGDSCNLWTARTRSSEDYELTLIRANQFSSFGQ